MLGMGCRALWKLKICGYGKYFFMVKRIKKEVNVMQQKQKILPVLVNSML
jgi:hypothetical protein